MSASTFANTPALAPTITPDLAAVLHDAQPHPQLGPVQAPAASSARLGKAAAAIAASLAAESAAGAGADESELIMLRAAYLLPPGTRARVHRAGPEGVLVLAPSARPRAVAAVGPGLYVVVEASAES